ncbi:MAG: hypothetical protein PHY56_05035 [Candidatus Omnitrophica bacterium]|nr:hypothetical protein [Candidatus Omnitrophota bacterium]
MKPGLKLFLSVLLLSLCLTVNAQASLKGYTYPYDISYIEWQSLNWTAAFRDTATPAAPFILERIEYNRDERKVIVYLRGALEDASDENLKKSIDGIVSLFHPRFPNFDPLTDLSVQYKLKDNEENTSYKAYNDGVFNNQQFPPEEPKSPTPRMALPASSY